MGLQLSSRFTTTVVIIFTAVLLAAASVSPSIAQKQQSVQPPADLRRAHGDIDPDMTNQFTQGSEPVPLPPLQAKPDITAVIPSGSSTIVHGTAGGTFVLHTTQVELYLVALDPSGYGEGRTYLGTATTDAEGNWQITLSGTSRRCFTAFETDYATVIENYWYSTEFGPVSCRIPLPILIK